jgi:hypothetical protein
MITRTGKNISCKADQTRYLINPNLGDTIDNTAVALEILILKNAGYTTL